MAMRRKRYHTFGVGELKSPHVLDLRKFVMSGNLVIPKRRRRGLKAREKKKTLPTPEFDEALLQEQVLRELAGIESRDVELARAFSAPQPQVGEVILTRGLPGENLVVENNDLVSQFFQRKKEVEKSEGGLQVAPPEDAVKEESFAFYFKKSRIFIMAAAAIAGFLFGTFSLYRGFIVREESMQKGREAYQAFTSAKDALKNWDFTTAGKDFSQAYESLVSAEGELNKIGAATVAIVKNIPFESRADSSLALLQASKHTAKAGEFLSSAFTLLPLDDAVSAGAFLKVLIGEKNDSKGSQGGYLIDVFETFQNKLLSAEAELLAAEKAMRKVKAEDFPEEFRESVNDLQKKIPILLDLTRTLKEYSGIFAFLLGKDGLSRYLIVFQNSSELRPTGGFIGTYAIVGLDGGKLEELLVEGIYEADGQLTVNVVPPKPFQHIATGWSTHDANWFLDFPTSAQKLMWLFERTGGGKVDGVLALNIEVIEQLLALTGPIVMKEYAITLDAENFRDKIQYEVEVAYDKKLNRPKKILSDFTPIFLGKLLEISKSRNKELVSLLVDALEQKYMMFYFKEEKVQEFFDAQGWTGSIKQSTINSQQSPNDFLAVVHSNIGGYKTDKYMEDGAHYNVEIKDDGLITGNVVVKRKHNGGNSKYWWYNKRNVDYVKIYVPTGAEIISSSGGLRREPDAPDYKILGFVEDSDVALYEENMRAFGPIDIFEESGKTVFGTWLATAAGSQSELVIAYKLPLPIEFHEGVGKYNLDLTKQPGTKINANVSVSYPQNWEVLWDNTSVPEQSLEQASLRQSFVLDRDKVIGYIFSK